MKAKLPSCVYIGGIRFTIAVEKLDGGDYGRMLFDERRILISTQCLAKAQTLRETLRHEILHAALHVSGASFLERYEEETVVRAVDHIFYPAWDSIKAKL